MNRIPFWFGAGAVSNVGVRLGAIGGGMLSVAGAFASAGGWFWPARRTQGRVGGAFGLAASWFQPVRLTQDRMMGAFQDAQGVHVGFRRNPAKGVCVSGWF